MNPVKMRHQRGRVRPTVRPADLAAHPADRWAWSRTAISVDDLVFRVLCAHCHREAPCLSEVYVHGQEGHHEACGGLWGRCDLFRRADAARQRETVP